MNWKNPAFLILGIIIAVIAVLLWSCNGCFPKPLEKQDFTLIYKGDYQGKKMNLYFINYGYGEKGIEQFNKDVNMLVFLKTDELKGFLEAEPFKSYKNRFNIYRINTLLDGKIPDCNPNSPCHVQLVFDYVFDTYHIQKQVQSPRPNTIFLLIPTESKDVRLGGAGGALDGGYYQLGDISESAEGGITSMFHEFGHSFAVIHDEYGYGYNWDFSPATIEEYNQHPGNFNCDPTPGCPKWCVGVPKPIQRSDICLERTTKEECDVDYFGPGTGLESVSCVWFADNPQITSYFGSKCIPQLDNYGNIGNSCKEGTGCFFGCSGLGWRSTYNSLYAGFFDGTNYSTYSGGGLHPYNKLQEEQIIKYIESWD